MEVSLTDLPSQEFYEQNKKLFGEILHPIEAEKFARGLIDKKTMRARKHSLDVEQLVKKNKFKFGFLQQCAR